MDIVEIQTYTGDEVAGMLSNVANENRVTGFKAAINILENEDENVKKTRHKSSIQRLRRELVTHDLQASLPELPAREEGGCPVRQSIPTHETKEGNGNIRDFLKFVASFSFCLVVFMGAFKLLGVM